MNTKSLLDRPAALFKTVAVILLLTVLCLLTLCGLFSGSLDSPAYGQAATNLFQPNLIKHQTNWTGLTNNQAALVSFGTATNQALAINPHEGMGVGVWFHGTNATTSNQLFYADVSHDGTHYTGGGGAPHYLTLTAAANGTNEMYYFFTIPATNLDNARMFQITAWSNSWTNGGMTVDGLDLSRINQ